MKVFLIAGEESGDRLGGGLMRALTARLGETVKFAGVGGHDMAKLGLTSLFPLEELSIVGIAAIVKRLPAILRRIRETADAAVAMNPDVVVIIDSPDFTHRVAHRVRRARPALPIVDYVSPSVWAWRPGRARAMRAYVDHVLALLPFEPAVYARSGGPACTYVGHPIVEEVALLRPDAAEARRRQLKPPLILLLPGSRAIEIRRLLETFGGAIALASQHCGPFETVLPTVPQLYETVKQAAAGWTFQPRIVVEPEEKRAAFRNARAALAASGTVTLELAVAGVPTIVAYKISLIEELVARAMIRVPSIVLANLVLGQNVVPALVQRQASAEQLATALMPLLDDTPERRAQTEAFARLDAIMNMGGPAPSERAAVIVLDMARTGRGEAAR